MPLKDTLTKTLIEYALMGTGYMYKEYLIPKESNEVFLLKIQVGLHLTLLGKKLKGSRGRLLLTGSIGLGGNPRIELFPGRSWRLSVGKRNLRLRSLWGRCFHLERVKISIYMIHRGLCFFILIAIGYFVLFVQRKINRGEYVELTQTMLDCRAQ